MSELHVRNLPPELLELLRERARTEGRSMSAEAVALLRSALQRSDDPSRGQQAAMARLHEIRRRSRLPDEGRSAEQLVRDDRDISG